MQLTLYAVPGSHPSLAVERALQLKRLPYERVDRLTFVGKPLQRLEFGKATVPGLKVDGDRVVGSRLIMRTLDALAPEPALYPADPPTRARVEEAEAWGDEVLQPLVRRITWAALTRDKDAMRSYVGNSKLPIPVGLAMQSAPLIAKAEVMLHGADDETVRGDLRALPDHLDRIDRWIADGPLGGDPPNAADLQIGASLRLALTLEDLRPLIDQRPAGALARRAFPDYPGEVPAGALPADWLKV